MADKTINTLDTELVSVGANDLIGVWDVAAAQYKKAKRSNVVGATITGAGTLATGGFTFTVPASMTAAGRDVANTFTQPQTMTQLKPASVSLANGATQLIGAAAFGVLLIENANAGAQAILWLAGGANTVVSINTRGAIAVTDIASNLCVYYSSGYYIKNNTGSPITAYYLLLGA